MRSLLASFTKNRFAGAFSGFLMTCSLQSSSATTVMVVSFANAGLLTLGQAIGPIMGANIGTTITGWIVATVGFKLKISSFALPIIGIGFPLTMLRSSRSKNWGEACLGFGLLFLGLSVLKDAVPDVKSNPEQLQFLAAWANHGFASVLLFVVVGTVLTIVVQSSAATMAITLVLAKEGWIDLPAAAGMVLGENLGTTITAYVASLGATRTAKRVARSHMLFNVIGVCWILPLMDPVLGALSVIAEGGAVIQLAAFHTAFNVLNTAMLIWFVPQIKRTVEWMVPYRVQEGDSGHIRYLDASLRQTPELAVLEVRRALPRMMSVVFDMFKKLEDVVRQPDKRLGDLVDEIKRGEDQTDHMEEEIVEFCTKLSRQSTSPEVAREIASSLDMANDIERMGDHCFNIVLLAQRAYEQKYSYADESRKELSELMGHVEAFIALASDGFDVDRTSVIGEARVLESKINAARDQGRKVHARMMQSGDLEVRAGLVYLDMMTNFEKLGDYCYNVAEMVSRNRSHAS